MSHLYANWHKLLIVAFAYALLAGCASTQCHNPRSMACMSQDDLIRELARPL